MKNIPMCALLVASALMASSAIQAAGFKEIRVEDAGQPDLAVGIWYPSDETPPESPNTRFGMALAIDAPVGETHGGLIVISHGYSGWYAGHADTAVALAEAGYIVAAPSHTGNTYSDMSSAPHQWVLDRPRHISKVIDHMLESDSLSKNVDPAKIGVYGFSAGGYTAVSLIGGVPDFDRAQQHCAEQPQEFVCAEGLINAMIASDMDELPAGAWGADKRIQAAAISAPGWAFAYPSSSLTDVSAQVQLWSGLLDSSVPTNTNAAYLARQLPVTPETHWIEKANHFAFLVVPCREAFKKEDPEEYKMVCDDATGFDRRKFHTAMHKEMVRFYDEALGIAR